MSDRPVQALDGIRVVDFGQYIAGPLAAMLLADHGADVIRVDPPSGRRWDSAADAVLSRGKRSIVLDLKTPAGRRAARGLVATADVVVENFRPGVMEGLGLGWHELISEHPRLVYCSIPGFSHADPRAGLAAFDAIVGAAAGVFSPTPGHLEREGGPVYTPITLPSNIGAFLAALAIATALVARDRDGLGQHIEVPLYDAMYDIISNPTTMPAANYPGSLTPMSDVQLAAFSGGGTYQCADDRWVDFWPVSRKFTRWFAEAAGIEDWAQDGLLDRDLVIESRTHYEELRRRLVRLFRQRSALEWERLGKSAGVPLALHRTSAEWIEDEHARAARAVVCVEDPVLGPMWQPGWAVTLSRTPPSVCPRRPLDGDRESILSELEGAERRPAATEPRPVTAGGSECRPPLDGLRVIDTAQVIAGPTVARLLADFGADVVKISNPPSPTPVDHLFINRGKRIALVDIRTDQGRDVLYRLLANADVLVQNFTRGRAEEFGIGYEQVAARRPEIVYCSISAYGYDGPWGAGRGYEPLGQTVTGLTTRFGGDGVPLYQPMRRVADYGAGILGAFGVVLALFERSRSGQGQQVQASLAHACTFHQIPFMLAHTGKRWGEEPHGQRAVGYGPLDRLHRARDGWLCVAGGLERGIALADVDELSSLAALSGEALESALAARFRDRAIADWLTILRDAGVEAYPCRTVADMLDDAYARSAGLSVTAELDGATIRTVGPAPHFSRTATVPVRLPAPYGADTADVLASIGMADRAAELAQRGIAVSAPIEVAG
jgi:crotonobetainyl-CoA:carnitine CoA-transferase CaiB-like acyl-CoA transferase